VTAADRLLVAAILLASVLHVAGGGRQDRRNYEVMPDMLESVPYGPFDANPNFPDGKTARPPIPGTVARGMPALAHGGSLLDVTRDWKELATEQRAAWDELPAPTEQPDDLARGRAIFGRICATCHGPAGLGDGLSTKRGVPPPPSLAAAGAREMSDGRIFRIITAGQGNMAAHAVQVARADRWRVVRFVRSLQTP